MTIYDDVVIEIGSTTFCVPPVESDVNDDDGCSFAENPPVGLSDIKCVESLVATDNGVKYFQ